MTTLKVTVVKKINAKDLYGDDLPVQYREDRMKPECDQFELNQEFTVDSLNCPDGFCNWAFADIQRDLVHIFFRGNYPWVKEKGVTLSCCTDGFRPVFFKIERMEE
ncbi:MAG: TIGR04076 family protein [Proteobacteria bacterium]|nr:TIGR04076 family protein [Pseudomonadota bacterium]